MQEEPDEVQHENVVLTMPPHKYPLWVLAFASGVALAVVYSTGLLPHYLRVAGMAKQAEHAYAQKDFQKSIQLYDQALELEPTANAVRISEAEVVFADGDSSNDEKGMSLLQGITLDKSAWARISAVLPPDYVQYFEDVKK